MAWTLALMWSTVLVTGAASGEEAAPVRTVERVELGRYVGEWFEIARFPNRFQRQCTGDVRATYAQRADGRLEVLNRCLTAEGTTEAKGIARVVDTRTFAKLKVRFAPAWLSWLPAVWGDYWILALGDDYSWAVVGSPDRKYLWILARKPAMDDQSYSAALTAARSNGFDTTRLERTRQSASSPDQVSHRR